MIAKSSHRECSEPLSQSYFIASLPFDDHKQRVGTDPPIIGCLHIRLTFVTAKISDVFVLLLWARLFWREMLYQVSTGNYSNVADVKTHGRKRKNVSLSRLVPSLCFFHSIEWEYFYCFVVNLNYLDFVSYFEDDVKFRFPFTSVTDTIDMEIECDTLLLLFNFSYDSHIHERNEWRTFYVRDFVDK